MGFANNFFYSTALLQLLILLQPAQLLLAVYDSSSALLLHSDSNIFLGKGGMNNPASLDLDVGFNISIGASFDQKHNGEPVSKEPTLHNTAIAMVEYGFFFPILSSPSFNSTTNSPQSLGFSFGFFFAYESGNTAMDDTITYKIYLAVCAGRSGNYSSYSIGHSMQGANDSGIHIKPYTVEDGFVVPMRIFNLDRPLRSVNFSLVLDDMGNGSRQLHLRDYDSSIVWRMSKVSSMEMKDTGILVLYDSVTKSKVVWDSNKVPTDTLLQGQSLKPGMKLESNDASCIAQMDKGGLVLSLNKAPFVEHPSPYWVFPILFTGNVTDFSDLNKMISSSPCGNEVDHTYAILANSSWFLFLKPGSCTLNYPFINAYYNREDQYEYSTVNLNHVPQSTSWSFVKLENDGKLYIYGVVNSAGRPSSQRNSIDSNTAIYGHSSPSAVLYSQVEVTNTFPFFAWGSCNVPMACGPLGLCTPDAPSPCSCPWPEFFDFINPLDTSKGCKHKPTSMVPSCQHSNDDHINSAQYLQLNSTSSIFLFSGWTFKYTITSTNVEDCKKSCTVNCSCSGFFYQASINSSCFFISDYNISLLNVNNESLGKVYNLSQVFAEQYVTFLKVALQPNATSGNKANDVFFIITVSVVPAFMACLMVGLAAYCLFRARRKRLKKISERLNEEDLKDVLPLLPSRFSYKDLREATGGFRNLLGTGACGSVYAGILPDGRKVAVKMLELPSRGQSKQFLAEVASIGRTNHVNVVHLVGFCWEVTHRLLVYEYLERGSLDRWLFSNADILISEKDVDDGSIVQAPLLDWRTRYNLALGIARGLSYLHEDCTPPILHFDIKPQNILLDNAFVPKLADFGMSKLMPRDISKVLTGVRGTPGYIAPEWLSVHGLVGKKSDVYSMGMVMLEIVGGRRNVDLARLDHSNNSIDLAQDEVWHFPSWAAEKCKQGMLMEIVDRRLQVCGFDEDQARTLIYTTFWCIQDDPEQRPYAPTVVQWLERKSHVRQPPFSTVPSLIKAESYSRSFASSSAAL